MTIECVIELTHDGDFDEDYFMDTLKDFLENDEQTYCDKGGIRLITDNCYALEKIGVD